MPDDMGIPLAGGHDPIGVWLCAIHPTSGNKNSPKFAVAMSRRRDTLRLSGRGYEVVSAPKQVDVALFVAWIRCKWWRLATAGLRENCEAQLAPRVQTHPGEAVFLCRVSQVRSLSYIRLR